MNRVVVMFFGFLSPPCLVPRSSMRRVTEVMNQIDSRKHEKFSNQFNYALN